MIKEQKIKTITTVFFGILLFISCNFIIKKDTKNTSIENAVSTNKIEANLLLKVSQESLNTIELCKTLKNKVDDKRVLESIKETKKGQVDIYNDLQEVASENLILIAKIPNQHINLETNKKDNIIIQIQKSLTKQKNILDSLNKQSDNQYILDFVEENITKLNTELTKSTLERVK